MKSEYANSQIDSVAYGQDNSENADISSLEGRNMI